jgi:DDE family transposase
MGSSHTLDQLDTCFDDTHAVANAGLLLAATLAERLGIEQAVDQVIDLGGRAGAHRPGRKLLTLVHSMLAGGDCIDDADVLRCGATSRVLGHRVMAPSTVGTFLRAFTFGHVRQLDRLTEQVLARAWAAGAGPGDGPMTMDLDSTVCEVHGHAKQGAAYGYTHTLGYHPLVASRADTGEVLHARQRTGRANTARGTARFVDELAARVRRAGASGELTMRMDSGSGRPRPSGPAAATRSATPSPSARPSRSAPRSPPSQRTPGSTSSTPTVASPRSPRPATGVTG